jgi:hypothetical protein
VWSIHHPEKTCNDVPEEIIKIAHEYISDPLFELELEQYISKYLYEL